MAWTKEKQNEYMRKYLAAKRRRGLCQKCKRQVKRAGLCEVHYGPTTQRMREYMRTYDRTEGVKRNGKRAGRKAGVRGRVEGTPDYQKRLVSKKKKPGAHPRLQEAYRVHYEGDGRVSFTEIVKPRIVPPLKKKEKAGEAKVRIVPPVKKKSNGKDGG